MANVVDLRSEGNGTGGQVAGFAPLAMPGGYGEVPSLRAALGNDVHVASVVGAVAAPPGPGTLMPGYNGIEMPGNAPALGSG